MAYDGTNLRVSVFDAGQVVRWYTWTPSRWAARSRVGRKPNGIAYDLPSRSIWVADTGDETVTCLDEESGRVIGRASTRGPLEGTLAADDGVASAAGSNDVVRIEPVGSS